jgi:ABC-2 type transport system permease protein
MSDLAGMLWFEFRKAYRSRMPLWTSLAAMFFPLGIAFLIFVARNPEISQKMGLVSAKASLVAYTAVDWSSYLSLVGQIIAAGGFFLLVFAVSWVFGREFSDGTVKDLLAVPVPRTIILLAKFIVLGAWSVLLTLVTFALSLGMGFLLKLPGFSLDMLWQSSGMILITACLAAIVALPFAFFASIGRGYLLPIAAAAFAMVLTNLIIILGWGEIFPWSVPMLYAQGKNILPAASYWSVFFTGMIGIAVTTLWWLRADQNR